MASQGRWHNPEAPRSRYGRGLKHLQAAHEAIQPLSGAVADSAPELCAMQAIASALYSRALEGDTAQWRAELAAACDEDTSPRLHELIQAGVAESDLYAATFDTLDRLAGRRHELQAIAIKRQHVITGAQVVELLALVLADLRAELDPQVYGRIVPRVMRRAPEIGLEERLARDGMAAP